MTLADFAKLAISRQEAARFGPKGMGGKCTAKDISKKSKKHMTNRDCAALFGLKKNSTNGGPKNVPPGGSAPHEPTTPSTYSMP